MQTVLTIAGTDPTGGAGAQADLKTFCAHKVYGMSIITALVAQNTMGVRAITNTTPDFLRQQFDCVFEDIYPDAIKIGMVSEPELIDVIVEKLKQYKAKNIVLDPVMVSTSGSKLLSDRALQALKERLIPLSSIITPNIPEAEVLVGHTIKCKDDMMQAAREISQWYSGSILIKGGHFKDRADDLLYHKESMIWLTSKHINNPNTHGTGCTLSSAIASHIALGETIPNAVQLAKDYINGALLDNLDLGQGRGPLNHCWNL